MRQVLRDVLTFAALTMLVSACTVEDVKETHAADSIAAATSKSPPPVASGSRAPVQASATGAASAPAATDSGAMTGRPAASTSDSGGNLAPDSVDVGRRGKANLLPLSRLRLEVDLSAKQLTAFDGDQKI